MNARAADLRFDFESDSSAPGRARHAVASLLGESDDAVADSVLLAVSELVTNVVRHTDNGGVVRAWDASVCAPLRIEVEDHSPVPPVVGGEVDIGGRGLLIVDQLADAWGFEATPAGKMLWAEFARSD